MQQENICTSKTTPSFIDSLRDDVFQKTQLLRIEEVCELTTLGKSTINLWVAQGKFPKPIHLSPTIKVWRLGDIAQWINSQIMGETNENQ
jgi:prophage regulatory protein